MDNLDQNIIRLLRRNARISISEMATELNIARATIRTRMERLSENNEILGFTVIMREDTNDMPVRGVTLIEITGKGHDKIISTLHGISEIQSIHTTNGRWDLIVEIGTDSLIALDNTLKKIRSIEGISASETNLYLKTHRSNQIIN